MAESKFILCSWKGTKGFQFRAGNLQKTQSFVVYLPLSGQCTGIMEVASKQHCIEGFSCRND